MADATRRVSVRLSVDGAVETKAALREVGETGQKSLDRVKEGSDRASRALALLDTATGAIQFAPLAAGLAALVRAGDQLTQSITRLQTAVGSVEGASEVYSRLYRDALQTGVAVKESVDAFARFSIAAREIGATSDQVATLVGGLQRVGIVAGLSSQEIANGTQQLAQGFASGVLQGDELRSLLENMPPLAQALAQELGVSIGELRKMGSEGKLTADTIFPAMLRAVERLGGELGRMPITIGRAFGQLQVATDGFLGQLDRAIGLSGALARALSGAARVLDGVRRGSGLLMPEEQDADRRAQAEALRAQIARLEAESEGQSLRAQPRRGSIRGGLAGTAQQQAGVDSAGRLEELRRQYAELQAEIARGEQAAGERQRTEQEGAATQAAEARRRRTAADAEELRKQLDDRFRINTEYEDRVRRLREAEAAGGITAADRTRLETLALGERDEALRRLEPRVAAVRRATNEGAREARDAEREVNEVLRLRTALIDQNATAGERYEAALARVAETARRAAAIGQPIPAETLDRERERLTGREELIERNLTAQERYNAALERMEEIQRRATANGTPVPDETMARERIRLQEELTKATERTSDTARDLGLTFSSAFEDAVLDGKRLSDILNGIARDAARIVLRRTITEPLGGAIASGLSSFSFTSLFSGLFRAEGGPVAGGQPYIVGERGPEWFVPDRGGTVLPNGTAPAAAAPVINTSIAIDARGADAGVEARLRLMAGQIARQASAMTLDAIRRGGTAYETVRG